jgi:uronate dehydrogenase
MKVACLRIGTCAEWPPDARSQATWLSPDDCARLVDACLSSPRLGYALVWGVSANRDRWWSAEGGLALGYEPSDDAADHFGDAPPTPKPWDNLVGGPLTDPWFGIDEVAGREALS